MTLLLSILFRMFLMILIGYVLCRKGHWNSSHQQCISSLLLLVVLPLNVLASADCALTRELGVGLIATACFALLYYSSSLLLMRFLAKRLNLSDEQKHLFPLLTVFANTGFIGFPIVGQLYGEEGVLYLTIYNLIFLLFFFLAGEPMLTGKKPASLLQLLKKPSILASLLAVILILTPIHLPAILQDTFEQIGTLMTPLSMFLIGASLADIAPKEIMYDKIAFAITLLRQLLMPLLAFVLIVFFPLPSLVIKTCVVTTALPAGTLTVVLAQEHHCAPQFASRTTVQGTVLMVVTLPIILALLEYTVT